MEFQASRTLLQAFLFIASILVLFFFLLFTLFCDKKETGMWDAEVEAEDKKKLKSNICIEMESK